MVDGVPWTHEAVGSNPALPTKMQYIMKLKIARKLKKRLKLKVKWVQIPPKRNRWYIETFSIKNLTFSKIYVIIYIEKVKKELQMAASTNGLGRYPLKVEIWVRIPLSLP